MSTAARRRLLRDFKRIQDDPPPGLSASPKENDLMQWTAIIFGPAGTPFEDGTFHLTLTFTEDYPIKPPRVRFLSRMFHPNIYTNGDICMDTLQSRWSPTYDVSAILTSIQSMLDEPNPNSPANATAATLYTENRNEYYKKVQQTVEQSWSFDPTTSPSDEDEDNNQLIEVMMREEFDVMMAEPDPVEAQETNMQTDE